jgi:hypothetical protein
VPISERDRQCRACAEKSRLNADNLEPVIELLKAPLWPPTCAVATGEAFNMQWVPIVRPSQ